MDGFVYPLVKKLIDVDPNCIIRICDTLGFSLPFEGTGNPYGVPERAGNSELEKALLFLVQRVEGFQTKNKRIEETAK